MLKRILLGLFIVGIFAGIFAYRQYRLILAPNVPEKLQHEIAYIPSGSTFNEVLESLYANHQILDSASFRKVAAMMNYKTGTVRPGRFRIFPSWSNHTLIRHLRAGLQEPAKLVLAHGWLLEDVATKASLFIEPDSADLMALFVNEDFINTYGYTPETLMSLFIPNTYECYWNIDEKGFFERMVKEHRAFWNADNRLSKAESLGMTTMEVYTLASIVEREISNDMEKRRVAGLYLNRLGEGMKLDADPTAKFATKDFGATRILYKHTRFDSPYNTYLNKGLPPGPISMASIKSIDAVLEAENHQFYYMCVDPENPGYHLFTETLTEHNRNAKKYHQWLDALKDQDSPTTSS